VTTAPDSAQVDPRSGGAGSPEGHGGGLARRSVNAFEVGAQSVANIAPSAVIAFGPAGMAASAGNGAWFSFLLGTAIALVIAYSIVVFARRRAGVGSLYSLIRPALGPSGSFVTGWALFIGVVGIASGSLAGAGFFASRVLTHLHVTVFEGTGGQIVLDLVLLAVGVYLTIASVRKAARVSATLEVISIALICLTLGIIYFKSGNLVDTEQLSLHGASLGGVVFAIVLAILGFVGFESAAALGEESEDPFRTIPRAVVGSAVLAGLLYIAATYAQVAQFKGGAAALAGSGAPMDDLTSQWNLTFLQPFLDFGFAASFFAVVVACVTVGARILFGMGNEAVLPRWFGVAHARHRTPARAIYVVTPLVAIPTAAVLAAGTEPLSATTYIDTVGVFGYMLAYALVCVGAPIFLRNLQASGVLTAWITGLAGAAALVYVFYRNVWPVPASPLDKLPYVFVAALVLGVAGYAALFVRAPERARQAGTFADDA
jgi:amino acid transporter